MKDKRQFIVWGLGRFGSSIAETLTTMGHEVLGIDNNEDVVENMEDKLTHAVVCDVIDEKTVKSLGVRNFDVGIVAIGTLEPSLLATMLLKEAGVKTIVAKASNAIHAKMLKKLGATQSISPERDMGRRVAHNLAYTNIMDFVELSDNICLMEVKLTPAMYGKSLAEMDVRKKYNVNVVAVKHKDGTSEMTLEPNKPMKDGDMLVVIGTRKSVEALEDGI
ncbi:MAG: TrkA family potassium uptake protein [Acidaminococcus sp.]|uniref:potassium channel family protein n=1 Tax=Acidaminococcus sp. TaxID=1872103 RepID=UPI0026DFEF7E|nr:TrkA family potassium uptake protein [Acidaminococcus sp.]MDO5597312.1 TrkA family potassium uptake protein [Acidaminococcus sp.]